NFRRNLFSAQNVTCDLLPRSIRAPLTSADPGLDSSAPLPAPPPSRARALAVDRLDRVRAEPDLALTAEEGELEALELRKRADADRRLVDGKPALRAFLVLRTKDVIDQHFQRASCVPPIQQVRTGLRAGVALLGAAPRVCSLRVGNGSD